MRILMGIMVMAIVTYIPRVLPLIIMKKDIQSKFIKSFLFYTPYTVLTAMTFPAMIYATGDIKSGIGGMVIAVAVSLFNGGLLIVSVVTVIGVYIINML